MAVFGAIIGIDNINGNKSYRVLMSKVNITGSNVNGEWQFKKLSMSEPEMIQSLGRNKYINICIKNNKVYGSAGSLDRFGKEQNKSGTKPVIILSELVTDDGRTIGYKICTYNGEVKNIPLKELIAFCNRITKSNGIPIQNAIFIPESENTKAHIKSYANAAFYKEMLKTNKNRYTEKAKVNTQSNEKALTRLEELFTKEQLVELRAAKNDGVELKIIANPALSANQMRILRAALKNGVNIRPIASPDFKDECMSFYIAELYNGCDIRSYLSPKYSLYQLSELSLAADAGLDMSKIGNPKLSATEMQEIRERMQNKLFKNIEISNDGKWKAWR